MKSFESVCVVTFNLLPAGKLKISIPFLYYRFLFKAEDSASEEGSCSNHGG